MANLDIGDWDKYAFDFAELERLPDSVIEEMLKAEGEVIRKAKSETARTMLNGPYNKGAVAAAAKVGKVKRVSDGKAVYITFAGKQHGTEISEIAFINEFGKRNQHPRPFIRAANEKYATEAVDAAAKIYNDYLTKNGL